MAHENGNGNGATLFRAAAPSRGSRFALFEPPPVDAVAVEERAASLGKRSLKKAAKIAGLRLAVSMMDLTTLEGKDTPGKVRQMCQKALRPLDSDPSIGPVGAVCVYPNLVPYAKEILAGSPVKIASVATAFPSGQSPLEIKLEDVRRAVGFGADEIDMVIDRGAMLAGQYDKVFDEIVATKDACGAAHLKVILETGELGTYDLVRKASELAIAAGADFIKIDDASRSVIDKLIAQKADAGSAYTSDPAALEEEQRQSAHPTTLRGIPAAAPTAPPPAVLAPPASAPALVAAAPAARAALPPPPAASLPVAPPPAAGRPMAKTMPMNASVLGSAVAKPVPTPTTPPVVAPPPARTGGPPAPVAHRPATAIGIGIAPPPAASLPVAAPPTTAVAPPRASEARDAAAPPPRPPPNPRKATMMGVGLPTPGSAPGAEKPRDKPTPIGELAPLPLPPTVEIQPRGAASPMFPVSEEPARDTSAAQEPTMMKQAAELLEEALREAGGSMEEIGQNPLFASSSQRGGSVEESTPPQDIGQSGDTLMMTTPMHHAAAVTGSTPPPSTSSPQSSAAAKAVPSSVVVASSPPPAAAPVRTSLREQVRDENEKKSTSSSLVAFALVLAVVVGGGFFAYRYGLLGSPPPAPTLPATVTPSAVPTPSTSASESPVRVPMEGGASGSTDAGATALGTALDAGAKPDAATTSPDEGALGIATAVAPRPPAPKPRPRPPAPTAPTATDPDREPTPPPTATPTTTPAPTATSTAAPDP